eukprot:6490376-Pyramimonas_sp.AAC.1
MARSTASSRTSARSLPRVARDDDSNARDREGIDKKRDAPFSSVAEMAKELFSRAAASEREAKEAHAQVAARLQAKRRGTGVGKAAGGPLVDVAQ